MELRQLRYFVAVAEERNITRAAERLGLQPPPLSRQIRAIERELDAQLFRRKPRGVELTDAGRAFLDNARSVIDQLNRAFETTRRTARGEQGRIKVGYTSGVSFHPLLPRVIQEFRDAFPLASVSLVEAYAPDLIERIHHNQIDAAFVRAPLANPPGIVVDFLFEEANIVALPSRHALARCESGGGTAISLKALGDEEFIICVRADGARTS